MIRGEIRAAGGWLPFARFMELALYAPGLGYYSAGSTKFGPAGDFVTAPEISALFGGCVARQCAQALHTVGGEIVEFGAGTGRMAATLLQSLAELGSLPERYSILEVSADLADRQKALLAGLPAVLRERVQWLHALPDRPVRGVIIANEVLDALPVERFVIRDGRAHPLGVSIDSARGNGTPAGFIWRADIGRTCHEELIGALPPLPDGYASEVGSNIRPWITAVSQSLERGLILLFDYGLPRAHYYHPQRTQGTLRCHFRQRAHDDPFINIAVQDITAWVDFTTVAEAADASGLGVSGFATQAAFLLGSGIEEQMACVDPTERIRLAGEARRLLMPGEMGEAFKAMALTRGYDEPLRGFAHQDLRASL